MKLLVNLNSLQYPLTGIGEYTLNLVKQLLLDERVVDIRGMHLHRHLSRQQIGQLVKKFDVPPNNSLKQKSKYAISRQGKLHLLGKVARKVLHIYSGIRLRWFKHLHGEYVYWEPNYTCQKHNGIVIPTIHDLSHLDCPHYHPQDRVRHLNKELPGTLARADHVIAVSDYTKQNLMHHFKIPEEAISIVSPSISTDFYPREPQECVGVTKKYNLPAQFILSVGTLEPRKNVTGLLQAYRLLPTELKQQYPLVLVGKRGWLLEEMDALLQPMLASGEVIWLGFVDRKDLPYIYSAAALLAYVSFYEGYGMPIAEAMACGTAVVASNSTSMVEASGDSVCHVAPTDHQAIADGMCKLLLDDHYRQQQQFEGLEVSRTRSWFAAKQQLYDAFLATVEMRAR